MITKEAIPDIIAAWSKEPDKPIDGIINKLGLRRMSPEEVRKYVMERASKLGINDRSKLMNTLMKELRGKADPSDIMRAIDEYLKKFSKEINRHKHRDAACSAFPHYIIYMQISNINSLSA